MPSVSQKKDKDEKKDKGFIAMIKRLLESGDPSVKDRLVYTTRKYKDELEKAAKED